MATNGVRASSIASSTTSSFVDASGYKFNKDDQKVGKVKIKKPGKKKVEATGSKHDEVSPRSSSPILPDMDDSIHSAFPDGKPREGMLDTIICKHCKRPVLKKNAKEHITACIKSKQEKALKKKKAREAAAKAKEQRDGGDAGDEDAKGVPDDDSEIKVEPVKPNGARKSAVKAAKDDESGKKGKKRKADEEDKDKEPKKKKKKKDEPKPKAPKPKGPVDVERQCGVALPNGAQCARSLTCKSHPMGAKRAVPGRSLPYDMLLQAYQKKNQARQQKAAIDANAPHNLSDSDLLDPSLGGAVDSDEERDNVMTALRRSLANPQPLAQHVLFPQKRKYQLVRMKEILGNAMVGNRAGVGLFSVLMDNGGRDSSFAVPAVNGTDTVSNGLTDSNSTGGITGSAASAANTIASPTTPATSGPGHVARKPSGVASGQAKARKPSIASSAGGD